MPRESLPLLDFARQFGAGIRFGFDFRRPMYSLILGAGASRSAGIPLAWEMTLALKKLARIRGIPLGRPNGESQLSHCFRRLWSKASQPSRERARDYAQSCREFLLSCIHRARKEANLTHLIAAHLATAGIVNPIVTTNFDDLALAAFWDLPWTTADDEPHVIYDPESTMHSSPRIAERVPIILKAHGHHTTYGMGYLDRQIFRAAPYVHALLTRLPRPTDGFIVVGYSGAWDDGVIQALADSELTARKTVYWLYVGEREPENEHIDRVAQNARVVFVQVPSADLALLHLWSAVPEDDGDGEIAFAFSIGRHLREENFLSYPRSWRPRRGPWAISGYQWFDPSLIHENGEDRAKDSARLEELRRDLVPILDRIDALDAKWLVDECISGPDRRLPRAMIEAARIEEVELGELAKRVPVDLDWTRRNRTLLRLGLSEDTGVQFGTMLLGAFTTRGL